MVEKTEAIDKVLGEQRLSLLERILLLQMIKNSGMDNVCCLSKSKLAELCGAARSAVRAAMKRLEEEGFLVTVEREGYSARYVPYPYSQDLITTKDKDKPGSKLAITPEQGKIILGVLVERENMLTLIARDAQARRDLAEHKRLCVQIDAILDIRDIMERYVKRNLVKG